MVFKGPEKRNMFFTSVGEQTCDFGLQGYRTKKAQTTTNHYTIIRLEVIKKEPKTTNNQESQDGVVFGPIQ